MSVCRTLACAWALAAASSPWAQTQADFNLPAPAGDPGPKLQLWSTHYFVHVAAPSPSGIPFRDKSGQALSDPVSPRDWCLAAIEGTVRTSLGDDARTLNYGGVGAKSSVDCAAILKINPVTKPWITSTGKSYFTRAIGPFGDGVAGYKLVPYRTLAVDKSVIPYGTVLYIPAAKGTEIAAPAGTVTHDGYFLAADTGGAIKGHHIDTFCGVTPTNCLPSFISSDATKTFDAFVVKDAAVIQALRALHK